MEVNSKIFELILGGSLISNLFLLWDRFKPESHKLKCYLDYSRNLIIENIGKKQITINSIEINDSELCKYSVEKRNFPLVIQPNNLISTKLSTHKDISFPEKCKISFKSLIGGSDKIYSI
jgi:hypothetical protein